MMDTASREKVIADLKHLFPQMTDEVIGLVISKLESVGMEHYDHRNFVDLEKYLDYLNPVQRSRLRKHWLTPGSHPAPGTSCVEDPPSTRPTTEGQDMDEPESDEFGRLVVKVKENWVQNSEVVISAKLPKNPQIRQLQMKETYVDPQSCFRHLSYGPENPLIPTKTMLVVGATGAGKSTLINAFANHLLGVEFEDDCRLRIVGEELDANQAHSQTQYITAYTLYHQATFPDEFPCSFMIVDTPGYGDARGLEQDEKIEKMLKHFFETTINALDAVGFVVQASLARLNPTQQYIFNSITRVFGKNIGENIFLLATFADGKEPQVIAAVEEYHFPYSDYFKFNNSALYADRSGANAHDKSDDFDDLFWAMGRKSYNKFLIKIAQAESQTLRLTNDVLAERDRIQTRVSHLHEKVKNAIRTSNNLHDALDCLRTNMNEIEKNKDFTFTTEKRQTRRKKLPKGQYVTNCLQCSKTCHSPCKIFKTADKWKCNVMDVSTGLCTACECSWKEHAHMPEKFVVIDVSVKETAQNMKARYEAACNSQLTTADVILKIINDTEITDSEIVSLIEEIRKSLERLHEIALRPDRMTTADYIDMLIGNEKQELLPGWQRRVEQLEAARERGALITQYAEFHCISEPFQVLKNEIIEAKKEGKAGRLKENGFIESVKIWSDQAKNWGKNTGKILSASRSHSRRHSTTTSSTKSTTTSTKSHSSTGSSGSSGKLPKTKGK